MMNVNVELGKDLQINYQTYHFTLNLEQINEQV
jgi:hypothetical protein